MEFITEYKEIIGGVIALAVLIAHETKSKKDDMWVMRIKKWWENVIKGQTES